MIDISKDAQAAVTDFKYSKCTRLRSYLPFPKVQKKEIDAAVSLINSSRKPLILAGHGVLISHAERELLQFAEKTGAPVALTLLGLSAFPSSHPLYVGMLGMHGNVGPNINTNKCDLIIAVGMRFDDRITSDLKTYAKQASVIHIEIDASEFNKNVEADVKILADAGDALRALLPKVKQSGNSEWLKSFREHDKLEYDRVINKKLNSKGSAIKMDEVVDLVCSLTKGDAIIVSDVGQNQMVAARNYKFSRTDSWVTSGGLGTMGFGLPAAVGAKIAAPDREVVLFAGDGGFQMTLQELGTVAQTGAAVKIIVLNNRFLGMVRQWQDMFYDKRYSFTEITSPDFVTLASAYGIKGKRVTSRDQLFDAVAEQINSEESFLLEVMVEREDNVFPMVPSGENVSNIRLD